MFELSWNRNDRDIRAESIPPIARIDTTDDGRFQGLRNDDFTASLKTRIDVAALDF